MQELGQAGLYVLAIIAIIAVVILTLTSISKHHNAEVQNTDNIGNAYNPDSSAITTGQVYAVAKRTCTAEQVYMDSRISIDNACQNAREKAEAYCAEIVCNSGSLRNYQPEYSNEQTFSFGGNWYACQIDVSAEVQC